MAGVLATYFTCLTQWCWLAPILVACHRRLENPCVNERGINVQQRSSEYDSSSLAQQNYAYRKSYRYAVWCSRLTVTSLYVLTVSCIILLTP
ncbi:hypothetical protein CPC08DRAFT_711728 [Agrocybe pediades]|nr:hypothetical protein CPC08DRAFT_711728 [Agrocybe pediades]